MKAKALLSFVLSFTLFFAFPAVQAAGAEAAPVLAEDDASDEEVTANEETPANEEDPADGKDTAKEEHPRLEEDAAPGVQKEESDAEDNGKASVSRKEFPCYLFDMEDSFDLPLYFINDVNDLPYIDLSDWIDILATVYQYILDDNAYELTLETDDNVALLTRENGYSMLIDFEECTFSFEDYDAFLHVSGDNSLLDMVSSDAFDEEGKPLLFKRIERGSFDRYGREIEINLADYDIPLYWSANDDIYLVPLQTMSDLFLSMIIGSGMFFNEEAVYAANETTFGLDAEELTPLGESFYSAPYGDMSEELAWYSYCELCLALDHLYGLKEIHDITTFDRIFAETGYKYYLTSTDPNVVDGALADFIHYYLDDLHSVFNQCSYRTEEVQMIGGGGLASRLSDSDGEIYKNARDNADHEITTYEEVGNTAYITFDSFDVLKGAAEYYEDELEVENDPSAEPFDTVALLIYAHEQICRKDSPIENVVIDLSLNGGGAVDAAAFVAAWFLGEGAMSIRSSLTGAVSTGVYMADVNLDGKFNKRDTVSNKNLFCIISPYSFSCGNLIPNIFKASHRVTLIGQTSGGGSCSVLPMSTAYGSMFQISSPNRMSYMKNGSYYDTDTGIDPDCVITKPENFYDREALTEYINQLF